MTATAEARQPAEIKFVNPNTDNFDRNIRHAATLGLPEVKPNTETGNKVVVVGSGPSLRLPENQARLKELVDEGAKIFACKAAIKYIHDLGYKIDYAASMDPGSHIAQPKKIFRAPGVKHFIATSSDPALFNYLKKETVILFNSACGLKNELDLYRELFENPVCVGGGFNVCNRAVTLCMYMDFKEIHLLGVDGGWKEGEPFYVDNTGPTVKKVTMHADLDGTRWFTAPDMLASCVAFARLYRENPGKLFFIGDTLPQYLKDKDNQFLDDCAKMG